MKEGFIYHRIEKGDTLKSIADKYGIPVIRLARMNGGIRNDKSLKVGSFLIIGDLARDAEQAKEIQQSGTDGMKPDYNKNDARLPEQWLTAEEIEKMALESVEKYSTDELKLARDRALEKLEQQSAEAEMEHEADKQRLKEDAETDKEDFRQDAIRQGIGRSSIVKSVEESIDSRAQSELGELEGKKQMKDAQNEGQAQYVLDKYRMEVADAKKRYEQALRDEQERIKQSNEKANLEVILSNGIVGDSQQYRVADKLLATLTKKQAADYLERNRESLRKLWGDDAIEKLSKKYK